MKEYKILSDCRGMNTEEIVNSIIDKREIHNEFEFFRPAEDIDDLISERIERYKDSKWTPYLERAAKVLWKHLNKISTIGVLFDVDLDGVTSGAIITRMIRDVGQHFIINTYINDGKNHGIMEKDLGEYSECDLLIIVDSLENSPKNYQYLMDRGTDVIVLDHHQLNKNVNYTRCTSAFVSSQLDCDNPFLSGSGVVWEFCCYFLLKYEDVLNFWNKEYYDGIRTWLEYHTDLAACGIIGDMMDMSALENRKIVAVGLNNLYNAALKGIIGDYEFNSTSVIYSIAPLINACNRMNRNDLAKKIFLERDEDKIKQYIAEMRKCKEKQQEVVENVYKQIENQCKEQENDKTMFVVIDTKDGISGLLANKLLSIYQKPIFVLKEKGNNYVGSFRTVEIAGFKDLCNESQLVSAAGHDFAAGITIPKDNLERFKKYLEDKLADFEVHQEVEVDILLNVEDITFDLCRQIGFFNRMTGNGFPTIKVMVNNLTSYDVGNMSKGKHLRITPDDNKDLWIIQWNFNGSFSELDDASVMNDRIIPVGTLELGMIGNKYVTKLICESVEVEEMI